MGKEKDMNGKKDLNKTEEKANKSGKAEDIKTKEGNSEEIIHFDTENVIAKEEINEQPVIDEAFLKINEELDRTKKAMLRLQADFENFKKRNADISRKAYNDGMSDTITEFLPLFDSFDNALKMLELKEDSGVMPMKKQLDKILQALDVAEIEALGKPFDPNLHNAVMRVEDEKNSGNIVEVFQKGYKLKDRIIRHTMVKVAN